MRKQRILYIHHGWGIGGAPLSLLTLIKNLNKDLFEIKVIFLRQSDAVALFKASEINCEVLSGYFFRHFYRYFQHTETKRLVLFKPHKWVRVFISWVISASFYAPKIIKRENPDIIHLNSIVLTDWCFAARKNKVKVVLHIREPLSQGTFGVRRFIIRRILKRYSDILIAISNDNASRVNLAGTTKVIYNPVNIPDTLIKKTEPIKIVVYMGGFQEVKGINLMIEILPLLSSDIEVHFLGNYPQFFTPGNTNSKLIGLINENDVMKELAHCDLLIVPNIKPHFSRPVIEAYATKTPVIASNIEGMEEIVFNGSTGFLVNPDAESFSNKINEVIHDEILLRRMGLEGFTFALNNFNGAVNSNKVQEIYLHLLS
jgi:glycosyltransferase involved in cell wall biosynthesis